MIEFIALVDIDFTLPGLDLRPVLEWDGVRVSGLVISVHPEKNIQLDHEGNVVGVVTGIYKCTYYDSKLTLIQTGLSATLALGLVPGVAYGENAIAIVPEPWEKLERPLSLVIAPTGATFKVRPLRLDILYVEYKVNPSGMVEVHREYN